MKNNQEWDAEEIKTPEHDGMVINLMENSLGLIGNNYNIQKIPLKKCKLEIVDIKTEVPVKANYYIVGYMDLIIEYKFKCPCEKCKGENWFEHERLGIEVKPKIDNFGSLVRQINKYREYLKLSHWAVYTNECSSKIKKALQSQNIDVLGNSEDEVKKIFGELD